MDFRRNKNKDVSLEASTDRSYGIYEGGLVFQYREPLTDKWVEQITREIERSWELQDTLDLLEQKRLQDNLEKQIDKVVEQTLDRALQKAFK